MGTVYLVLTVVVLIGGMVWGAKKYGALNAKRKYLENNLKAGRDRKEINREIQNLTPDELIDRLRRDGL